MPVVDVVADGLTDEVVGDGETSQAVVGEQFPLGFDRLGGPHGVDIEVVAPAGEFESVVAHALGEGREFFERQIGPLAGEKSNGSGHDTRG